MNRENEVSDSDQAEKDVVYLVLGLVWLGLAVVAFTRPEPWTIPNTEISIGWVGLFFFAYNMARWFGTRRSQADRRVLTPAPPRPLPPEESPNPEFNFTEAPPRPAEPKAATEANFTEKPPHPGQA